MSRTSFEHFGRLAETCGDTTQVAGRMCFQAEAEQAIVPDVACKLRLAPDDRLLEIGCGPGNLLLPLAGLAAAAVGVDHPACLEALARRGPGPAVRLVAGNFLDIPAGDLGAFDAVLVYSVLQYLSGPEELRSFVRKAAGLLAPGGRLLLGDLPNQSKKARFLDSEAGREADRRWREQCAAAGPGAPACGDDRLVRLDDAAVLGLVANLRALGLDAFILPQPPQLPFSGSREDILAVRPR